MEEFQESDVIWPEESHRPVVPTRSTDKSFNRSTSNSNWCNRRFNESNPINVPPVRRRSWKMEFHNNNGIINNDYSGGGGKEEFVPPHVILARRCTDEMAFSVCTGNGRTLKGRDLSRVRNSVLRLTGFLEG